MRLCASLASLSGLRISVAMSCGVVHRYGSDLALLWLWCRPAATALIRPVAWEPPYATGVALKRQKKKKKKKERKLVPNLAMDEEGDCMCFFNVIVMHPLSIQG